MGSEEKKNIGRPTVLTQEIQDELVKYLSIGNYLETACDMVGVNTQMVKRWIYAGARGNPKYKEFSDAIKRAHAQAEVMLLALIDRAAQGGAWQAAAWRLERKFPDKWGRWEREKDDIEVEGKGISKVRIRWIKARNNEETRDNDT